MEPILALIVIEQTIGMVVIAVAIVIYSRATTRILEAHVEPEVHVHVEGDSLSNSLQINNHAGCALSRVSVIVSAGCVWGAHPYPARHCLYFGRWDAIANGAAPIVVPQPLRAEALTSAQLPDGAEVDLSDISVEYCFTRRADKRRYSFKYQLALFKQSDGKLLYVRLGEPRLLSRDTCDSGPERGDCPADPRQGALLPVGASGDLAIAAPCIG